MLEERYQGQLYFTSQPGKPQLLVFKDQKDKILEEHFKSNLSDGTDSDLALAITVAKLIKNEIKTKTFDSKLYPSIHAMTNDELSCPVLDCIAAELFRKETQRILWKQSIIKSQHPRSGPQPYLMGISLKLAHKFNSKWLVNYLHELGICESYKELHRYRWSYLKAKRDNVLKKATTDVQVNSGQVDNVDDSDDALSDSEVSFDINLDSDLDSEISFDPEGASQQLGRPPESCK